MKVVRSKVEEHFRTRLDELYATGGKMVRHVGNLEALKKLLA